MKRRGIMRRIPVSLGLPAAWRCRIGLSTPAGAGAGEHTAAHLERLKDRLVAQELADAWDPRLDTWLRRAGEEAASLAWTTPYPLLVLPLLVEEKAAEARQHHAHQQWVQLESEGILWSTGLAGRAAPSPVLSCAAPRTGPPMPIARCRPAAGAGRW
jgi:hypothetical protein